MGMKTCEACGTGLSVHWNYCPHCGEATKDIDAETGTADDQEFGGVTADMVRGILKNETKD